MAYTTMLSRDFMLHPLMKIAIDSRFAVEKEGSESPQGASFKRQIFQIEYLEPPITILDELDVNSKFRDLAKKIESLVIEEYEVDNDPDKLLCEMRMEIKL